jgi:ABC-type nickel/cobalt efflux system permease component RcnA
VTGISGKIQRTTLIALALPLALAAHPMGNFSVSHYSRLDFKSGAVEVQYVLDLAEIPAFQLLDSWQIDSKDQSLLEAKCRIEAQSWLKNVVITQAGHRFPLRLTSVDPTAMEGAGGLPVLRISMLAEASPQPGAMTYEDRNFPGRAGWKEIVIDHDPSVKIAKSSFGETDISKALTFYPTDPAINQPQDLTAQVEWSLVQTKPAPVVTSSIKPPPVPAPVPFSQRPSTGPGAVVRGDFLSKMLQRKELSGSLILLGICVAFGLGSMHAMSPGHGKTIVAAYLVGSRGTLKHAGLLGFTVTFTHTFTVFVLGLGMLFFQKYFVAENVVATLGAVSGLSIVGVGLYLLYQRARALMDCFDHSHTHEQAFPETSRPAYTRIAELRAAESGQPLKTDSFIHSHGGSTHSHNIDGEITPGSLIALGVSGGIVPCPSALILMLSAIALGYPGFGLVLLVGFSSGLALVLIAIGAMALYARHLLPDSQKASRHPAVRLIPVFSSVVVIVLGLAITAVSAGWIQPVRFLS